MIGFVLSRVRPSDGCGRKKQRTLALEHLEPKLLLVSFDGVEADHPVVAEQICFPVQQIVSVAAESVQAESANSRPVTIGITRGTESGTPNTDQDSMGATLPEDQRVSLAGRESAGIGPFSCPDQADNFRGEVVQVQAEDPASPVVAATGSVTEYSAEEKSSSPNVAKSPRRPVIIQLKRRSMPVDREPPADATGDAPELDSRLADTSGPVGRSVLNISSDPATATGTRVERTPAPLPNGPVDPPPNRSVSIVNLRRRLMLASSIERITSSLAQEAGENSSNTTWSEMVDAALMAAANDQTGADDQTGAEQTEQPPRTVGRTARRL